MISETSRAESIARERTIAHFVKRYRASPLINTALISPKGVWVLKRRDTMSHSSLQFLCGENLLDAEPVRRFNVSDILAERADQFTHSLVHWRRQVLIPLHAVSVFRPPYLHSAFRRL